MEKDSLEEMDNITRLFDNANDFRDGMNEVHETKYDIVNLFLQKERKCVSQRLPVVYSEDIFDIDDNELLEREMRKFNLTNGKMKFVLQKV